MTEIRIYEEHNKVVVCREKSAKQDRLHDIVKHALDWQDDSYEYYRLPLDEFMMSVTTLLSATDNTVE